MESFPDCTAQHCCRHTCTSLLAQGAARGTSCLPGGRLQCRKVVSLPLASSKTVPTGETFLLLFTTKQHQPSPKVLWRPLFFWGLITFPHSSRPSGGRGQQAAWLQGAQPTAGRAGREGSSPQPEAHGEGAAVSQASATAAAALFTRWQEGKN